MDRTERQDWLFLVKRTFDQTPMPYTALMGNKADLSHIRAVKTEKHSQFADENDLYSYFVSARTGDQVHSAFFRIAADLAGVSLTRPELEVEQKITRAEVVNHPRNDPAHPEVNAEDVGKEKKCTVM
ncbi:unnamed protein product [Durusdinium trenchii]|uniref:Uncharacterized protein n=1 Tax=Durusdinium trenchii TaxID=1381693 RepID=A0ABP0LB13_9DINO